MTLRNVIASVIDSFLRQFQHKIGCSLEVLKTFLISGLIVPIFFLLQERGRLQGEERANERRVRRKGGGQKTTVSKDPSLKEELERLAVTVMPQGRKGISLQLCEVAGILERDRAVGSFHARTCDHHGRIIGAAHNPL